MQELLDLLSIAGFMLFVVSMISLVMVIPELKKSGTRKVNVCIEKPNKWSLSEGYEAEWIQDYLESEEI